MSAQPNLPLSIEESRVTAPESASDRHGVLYFDPTGQTTRLARASLRLAGYEVFVAKSAVEVEDVLETYGPTGEGRIAAILFDASGNPADLRDALTCARVADESTPLPTILIVDPARPNPVPEAVRLPCLTHPISTPAMARMVAKCIEDASPIRSTTMRVSAAAVDAAEADVISGVSAAQQRGYRAAFIVTVVLAVMIGAFAIVSMKWQQVSQLVSPDVPAAAPGFLPAGDVRSRVEPERDVVAPVEAPAPVAAPTPPNERGIAVGAEDDEAAAVGEVAGADTGQHGQAGGEVAPNAAAATQPVVVPGEPVVEPEDAPPPIRRVAPRPRRRPAPARVEPSPKRERSVGAMEANPYKNVD